MNAITTWWKSFAKNHETSAQFIVFFILSNGVTVLQLVLMPVFKWIFGKTAMVDSSLTPSISSSWGRRRPST